MMQSNYEKWFDFFLNIHEYRINNDPSEVISTNYYQCLAATFFDHTKKKDEFFFLYITVSLSLYRTLLAAL